MIPASRALMIKSEVRCRPTFIPESLAACEFAPMRYVRLPDTVIFSKMKATTTRPIMISTEILMDVP